MVEHYRSYDPDIDGYDENSSDHPVTPYRFGQSARRNSPPEESVPLFLSDYDGEPDPSEYMPPLRRRRASISLRLLAGVSAAAAVAVLFALFSSDAMRDVVNVKASVAGIAPAPAATAQSDPSLLASSAENDRRGAGGSLARRLVGWRTNRAESQPLELSLTGKA